MVNSGGLREFVESKDKPMETEKFFVYLNIEPLPAAWAAYRGVMCSASSVGTKEFRPIAYWPYGLMRKAAAGDERARLRLEKEIALEDVRRRAYPCQSKSASRNLCLGISGRRDSL